MKRAKTCEEPYAIAASRLRYDSKYPSAACITQFNSPYVPKLPEAKDELAYLRRIRAVLASDATESFRRAGVSAGEVKPSRAVFVATLIRLIPVIASHARIVTLSNLTRASDETESSFNGRILHTAELIAKLPKHARGVQAARLILDFDAALLQSVKLAAMTLKAKVDDAVTDLSKGQSDGVKKVSDELDAISKTLSKIRSQAKNAAKALDVYYQAQKDYRKSALLASTALSAAARESTKTLTTGVVLFVGSSGRAETGPPLTERIKDLATSEQLRTAHEVAVWRSVVQGLDEESGEAVLTVPARRGSAVCDLGGFVEKLPKQEDITALGMGIASNSGKNRALVKRIQGALDDTAACAENRLKERVRTRGSDPSDDVALALSKLVCLRRRYDFQAGANAATLEQIIRQQPVHDSQCTSCLQPGEGSGTPTTTDLERVTTLLAAVDALIASQERSGGFGVIPVDDVKEVADGEDDGMTPGDGGLDPEVPDGDDSADDDGTMPVGDDGTTGGW